MVNVAAFICDQLAHWGVDRLFGVSGANIELLFDAAVRHPTVDAVLAKHEGAAATMAIGWTQRSGLPGVVATTSGGAAFHIVAALTEALDSEIPLLALVGQCATSGEGRGAFQDSSGGETAVDAARILAAASIHCERVGESPRLPGALHEAMAAPTPGPGPAVLLLPRDVQAGECASEAAALPQTPPEPVTAPSRRLVRRLVSAINSDVPPLVIAGRGALAGDARAELAELVHAWDAAIAVAPDAKGAVASDDPHLLGVAGIMGHRGVREYLDRRPVCVLAGTRLPDVAGFGLAAALPATTVVSINSRPCFPGLAGHPDVHELRGPLAAELAQLRRATGTRRVPRSPTTVPEGTRPYAAADARGRTTRHAEPISSIEAIRTLAERLEPGSDVFIDAGNAGAFAVHHLPSDGIGLRSIALGMGAMGYAFGAAIGACECTGRRTYVIAGDGSFYMHGLEIHTAIERRLPITFLIVNNNSHAMCRLREELLLGGVTQTNTFAPARIAAGLQAMFPTLAGAEVLTLGELRAALDRERACDGPFAISVTVDADEPPPFWSLAHSQSKQEIAA
jgi:acetolactate synthase-1/2/3 large subunit